MGEVRPAAARRSSTLCWVNWQGTQCLRWQRRERGSRFRRFVGELLLAGWKGHRENNLWPFSGFPHPPPSPIWTRTNERASHSKGGVESFARPGRTAPGRSCWLCASSALGGAAPEPPLFLWAKGVINKGWGVGGRGAGGGGRFHS